MIDRVRKICLVYPGAIEKLSHGEPTFFTPKHVFAMCSNNHGDGHIAVWLPAAPGVQAELMAERPEVLLRSTSAKTGGSASNSRVSAMTSWAH